MPPKSSDMPPPGSQSQQARSSQDRQSSSQDRPSRSQDRPSSSQDRHSSSQGNPSSSQGNVSSQGRQEDTEWKLKDCVMEVASIGKKDASKDEFMTIDLIFKFTEDPIPKVVGELLMCNSILLLGKKTMNDQNKPLVWHLILFLRLFSSGDMTFSDFPLVVCCGITTLGSILNSQLSWESCKFHLARWSYRSNWNRLPQLRFFSQCCAVSPTQCRAVSSPQCCVVSPPQCCMVSQTHCCAVSPPKFCACPHPNIVWCPHPNVVRCHQFNAVQCCQTNVVLCCQPNLVQCRQPNVVRCPYTLCGVYTMFAVSPPKCCALSPAQIFPP